MTKSTYQPPYTITPEILNRVAAISEAIGRLTVLTDQARALRLRRINRIRTIHGSLAIESNTLSEAQITAILEGKRVIAPPREVQEVKNALAAYDRFDTWKPEAEKDLLEAHRILMSGLIDEAGLYRHGGVGVMAGQQVIHMAPPADRVPHLMANMPGDAAFKNGRPKPEDVLPDETTTTLTNEAGQGRSRTSCPMFPASLFKEVPHEDSDPLHPAFRPIRFPFWEPNRRPKTGYEVVAVRRQVSGFTANPSPSSGAGKSGEKIVSLVGLAGSGCAR